MSAPAWSELEALFHEALACPAAERVAVLAERCAGRPELRVQVEAMLRAHDEARGALDVSAMTTHARLEPGTRLGVYEIGAQLGAGGMGEVYRATDTTLGRQVAIKVLPAAFAGDPDRLSRFEREAKTLAALNHPNIAQIYGFEKADGVRALAMELVEGETLADRIARGTVPLDEALAIAKQIAEALDAAHEHGIIHRDLKPSNIKLRPDGMVKVLDFGLAKALDPGSAATIDATASPTMTSPAMMTGVGVLLGTAAYMSPEQARGKPVDKRADIWAFGCVLYEMLTGKRAFEGEDASDTLAAVLRSEPDWVALPADLPTSLHTMLRGCLAKDRKRRIGDVAVVQYVLSEPALTSGSGGTLAAASAVPTPRPLWRRAIPIAAATLIGAAVASGVVWTSRRPAPQAQVARFSFPLPEGQTFLNTMPQTVAISRDGTQMAYTANSQLYLRTIRDPEPKPIAGTGDTGGAASVPVFSPDGQSIVFHSLAMGALRRIPVGGGTAVTICPADLPTGLSWSDDGIVFGQGAKGIMRVSPNGGNPEPLVTVEAGEFVLSPQILPGGRAVLFTVARGNTFDQYQWDMARIVAQSLETGERKVLVEGGSDARYVPTGHIVYAIGGAIFAVPFDVVNLQVTGGPVPVIDGVRRTAAVSAAGLAFFSFSDTGSVIYVPGPPVDVSGGRRSILVADQKGAVELLQIPPGPYEHPRVSPDGRRIAFDTDDGKEAIVWIYDLAGTTAMRRLTFGGRNRFPIWTADGQRLTFQSDRDGDLGIYWQRANGAGTAERLTQADQGTSHVPESWSPKSETLLFSVVKDSNAALWAFSMGTKKAGVFGDVRSATPITAVFSPDGRWVAYHSDEIGGDTVYVQPFPATGAKYQIAKIATQLDHHPAWSRDGKSLFYIPNVGTLAAVSVTTEPTFSFGNALPIPRKFTELSAQSYLRNYDITPDGKFIGLVASEGSQSAFAPVEFRVVLNWFEELKRLVPTN